MKARSQSSSTRKKRFDSSRAGSTCAQILAELKRLGEKRNVDGMARYGIVAKSVYGVSNPTLDGVARRTGRTHKLALELRDSGVHEGRILAGLIDEPHKATAAQRDPWIRDFDN